MKAPHQNVTFEQLIAKVKRAEDLLEERERRTVVSYRRLKQVWREGWTPLRIVSAGLVSGFLVGRAEPLGAVGGARILQMVSAVSSLFASAQAAAAADDAKDAADEAGDVAAVAADAAGAPAVAAVAADAAGAPAAVVERDPDYMAADDPTRRRAQAAEAATELSER